MDDSETVKKFGQLRYHREEKRIRKNKLEPLIIFRIEYDLQEKITIVTQSGLPLIQIILEILGLAGGLFNPIFAGSTVFVAFIVRPAFLAFMTEKLFLIKKFKTKEKIN